MLGIRDVVVLEQSYIGSGGSGRNTAIIRSNYRTPEGVAFYDESVHLYERLSADLGFNVLFSQQGHLTLAHTEPAVTGLRVRAEVNQLMRVSSRLISPEEIKRLRGALNNAMVGDVQTEYIQLLEREIGVTVNERALQQVLSGRNAIDDN